MSESMTLRNAVIAALFSICVTFMWRQMDKIDAQDTRIEAQQERIMELKMQVAVLQDQQRILIDHAAWGNR